MTTIDPSKPVNDSNNDRTIVLTIPSLSHIAKFLFGFLISSYFLILLLAIYVFWVTHNLPGPPQPPDPTPTPAPTPPPDDPVSAGVQAGRDLQKPILKSLADALRVAESDIKAGKKIDDAKTHLQDVFHQKRIKVFSDIAGPLLAGIVPDGSETDLNTRIPYAEMLGDIADGLDGK